MKRNETSTGADNFLSAYLAGCSDWRVRLRSMHKDVNISLSDWAGEKRKRKRKEKEKAGAKVGKEPSYNLIKFLQNASRSCRLFPRSWQRVGGPF